MADKAEVTLRTVGKEVSRQKVSRERARELEDEPFREGSGVVSTHVRDTEPQQW